MSGQRPSFTLSEASALVEVSRSTLRRRLDQGQFPNAFRTTKGIWKIPLTDLLAQDLKPARQGVNSEQFAVSNDIGQPENDIGQSEQVDLKNRIIQLENDLSIERAHRSAAEQVAVSERRRAQTAEMALRMLEQAPRTTVTQPEQVVTQSEQFTAPPMPVSESDPPPAQAAPKRRWWHRK